MRNGLYYLNNSGTRWIVFENGKKPKVDLLTKGGRIITRTPIFWEQCGNYATVCVSYKGNRIKIFPDSLLDD